MEGHNTIPPSAEFLAQIPDCRSARGKRHPLPPVMLLTGVAMLCGAWSQEAIPEWAANYGPPWLARLGFARDRGPSQPKLSRIFKHIAAAAVEAALRH